jgi:hypothetical protein
MTDQLNEAGIEDAARILERYKMTPGQSAHATASAAITAYLAAKAGERADGAMLPLEPSDLAIAEATEAVSFNKLMSNRQIAYVALRAAYAIDAAPKAPIAEGWKASREQIGEAIYLAMYGHQGGKWEANDSKETWYRIANRFLVMLPAPPTTGEQK